MAATIGWYYDNHRDFSDALLRERAGQALVLIYNKTPLELATLAKDTRSIHGQYFFGLTPEDAPYFAGNYRGSDYLGLRSYFVSFGGRSGIQPQHVETQMKTLAEQMAVLFVRYELTWSIDTNVSPATKLFRLAEATCAVFVAFLSIHPYADGNGHMSRLILMIFFIRYGFRLINMPIHPRPVPNPSLPDLINLYRAGDRRPLIHFVISTL